MQDCLLYCAPRENAELGGRVEKAVKDINEVFFSKIFDPPKLSSVDEAAIEVQKHYETLQTIGSSYHNDSLMIKDHIRLTHIQAYNALVERVSLLISNADLSIYNSGMIPLGGSVGWNVIELQNPISKNQLNKKKVAGLIDPRVTRNVERSPSQLDTDSSIHALNLLKSALATFPIIGNDLNQNHNSSQHINSNFNFNLTNQTLPSQYQQYSYDNEIQTQREISFFLPHPLELSTSPESTQFLQTIIPIFRYAVVLMHIAHNVQDMLVGLGVIPAVSDSEDLPIEQLCDSSEEQHFSQARTQADDKIIHAPSLPHPECALELLSASVQQIGLQTRGDNGLPLGSSQFVCTHWNNTEVREAGLGQIIKLVGEASPLLKSISDSICSLLEKSHITSSTIQALFCFVAFCIAPTRLCSRYWNKPINLNGLRKRSKIGSFFIRAKGNADQVSGRLLRLIRDRNLEYLPPIDKVQDSSSKQIYIDEA
ncbi:MAG: hypothetical protein EZS28_032281, partial [Streblomastix strix]